MNDKQIERLRQIEQDDEERFAKVWKTLNESDKRNYVGAIFWERIEDMGQPKRLDHIATVPWGD